MTTYAVTVIKYEKGKKELFYENWDADHFSMDEHNNLYLWGEVQDLVKLWHSYNWHSIEPLPVVA